MGAACLATLTSPPGASSGGLGVILLASSVCLLVPAAGSRSKVVPALVILTSAIRFAVTGIAEINGGQGWLHAAGWAGIVLAAISGYAALAHELEGRTMARTVLPLGRTGAARAAVDGNLDDQVGDVENEPGVRQRRLAVVDHDGRLLGLLCLKRAHHGFCSDQDVASREEACVAGSAGGPSTPRGR